MYAWLGERINADSLEGFFFFFYEHVHFLDIKANYVIIL